MELTWKNIFYVTLELSFMGLGIFAITGNEYSWWAAVCFHMSILVYRNRMSGS